MVILDRRGLVLGASALALVRPFAAIAQEPLRLEITSGVIEPMPFAMPAFLPDDPGAAAMAQQVRDVVLSDLTSTGLFREIPAEAHIGRVGDFDAPVNYADWRAINAQALVTGSVGQTGDRVAVRFRLWDVFGGAPMEALQFEGATSGWRRMAHKVADAVYARLTGEAAYFDSRVAFVAESGPKAGRRKAISVMDYDGANVRALTDGAALVVSPRISPDAKRLLYISYEAGTPRIFLLDTASGARQALENVGDMSFAPRFSRDGAQAVYSVSEGTGSNIYVIDLAARSRRSITQTSSIDTAPSFSPDGSQVVFESDRAGTQQLYVLSAAGGEPRRISFGEGRYASPVWSPRGDLISFTKIVGGRFHIGGMRPDGSDEKLLTGSYIDEGPTWAPNGRVLMFFRESPGAEGGPQLFTVDITGRNLQRVGVSGFASDPSWSALLS